MRHIVLIGWLAVVAAIGFGLAAADAPPWTLLAVVLVVVAAADRPARRAQRRQGLGRAAIAAQ